MAVSDIVISMWTTVIYTQDFIGNTRFVTCDILFERLHVSVSCSDEPSTDP